MKLSLISAAVLAFTATGAFARSCLEVGGNLKAA
jgi:hypothetical protein